MKTYSLPKKSFPKMLLAVCALAPRMAAGNSCKAITLLHTRLIRLASGALLALILASSVAQGATGQCIDTNVTKFYLPPQTQPDLGFDVKDSRNNIVLADDFPCTSTGPITGIHVWGSWISDLHGSISNFWIGIYSDVPAVTLPATGQILTNSHPGILLWSNNFSAVAGQFTESFYTNVFYEYFYSNNVTTNCTGVIGQDTQVYEYCFFPSNPFMQMGTAANPTNYWLAMRAQLYDTNTQIIYGWKSAAIPYGDPAVWGNVAGGLPIGNWQSITNPFDCQTPMHLSMRLTTTNSPQPCAQSGNVKYEQDPNLYRGDGADVWNSDPFPPGVTDGPWFLADDFKCTNPGPITDIHLWGSWQNDQALPGAITFQLYVLDDVATNSANPFSHPGTNIFWHQTFTPGSYAETIWVTNAVEYFLDPGPPQIIGSDRVVWYYCFNPTNLYQYGTATQPSNYWLVAFAELPTGVPNVFGWKTTTNVQNDISVHAPWTGFGNPPLGVAWAPTYEFGPGNTAVDLAFMLTTATNQCPPPQLLCSNAVFECGTSWVLIPPGVIDPCCPVTAQPFPLNSQTNGNLCNQTISVTWAYTNCNGQSAICTQYVTVHDTTPPYFLNCSNYNITCGTPFPPPPIALDQCCTNVTVTLSGSLTNGAACNQVITQFWQAMDCCTNFAYCTQVVTVAASPPQLLCTSTNILCGTPLPLGPPPYIDSCCTNVLVTLYGSFTNNNGCNKTIYQTWQALDLCCTNYAYCTQIVNVTYPPPTLLCSNYFITCGSPFPTNPPGIDACCSNVIVSLLASTTNTSGCVKTISQTWQAFDVCCTNSTICTQLVTVVGNNNLVVPNAYASTGGDGGNTYPFDIGGGNMRYQQVYASSQFGVIPPGGAFITAIAFRPGPGFPGFAPTTLPSIKINLSTTAKSPDGLDPTFANNIGADHTLVFSGPLTLSSAGAGSPPAFDILIPLSTPFFYNPAAGNLLLDVTNASGGTTTPLDSVFLLGDSVSREYAGVSSPTGSSDSTGLITEFMLGPALQLVCSNVVIPCGSPLPNPPAYVDFCCTNVTLTLVNSFTNDNGCANGKTIFQTWQATDCCNNVTNCTRIITVLPSPPVLLCTTTNIGCGVPIPTNPPVVLDLCCTNVVVNLLGSTTNANGCNKTIFRTWQALDLCCTSSVICTQIVNIVPVPPQLVCSNITLFCGSPFPPPPAVIDLCCSNDVLTLISSFTNSFPCSNVVSQNWTVTNCCNNGGFCSRTITFVPPPPTIFGCSNILVKTCSSNVVVFWPTNGSSPCSSVTVTSSPPSGMVFLPNTTNLITLTAWDTCGHSNTCTFSVTVVRPVLLPLTITYLMPNITIHWTDGILQQADEVYGPFTDVPSAPPPTYTVAASAARRFYRLRCLSP